MFIEQRLFQTSKVLTARLTDSTQTIFLKELQVTLIKAFYTNEGNFTFIKAVARKQLHSLF